MIDLKDLREHPEKYKKGAIDKGISIDRERFGELDELLKTAKQEAEELQAKRNALSKEIDEKKRAGEDFMPLVEKVKAFKSELEEKETALHTLQQEHTALVYQIPSPAFDDVPVGHSDAENVVDEELGTKPSFGFSPQTHRDLLEAKGYLDQERAVKLSGSRFQLMRGPFAQLAMALVNWTIAKLVSKGFSFTLVPQLVRADALVTTGFLPNDAMNIYRVNPEIGLKSKEKIVSIIRKEVDELKVRSQKLKNELDSGKLDEKRSHEIELEIESDNKLMDEIEHDIFSIQGGKWEEDDLWLIGTAEVALVAQHMHETLDTSKLPLRYAGYSSCYRREAGTYGKDTKGLIRLHQFEKVEMVSFVKPEDSAKEHEYIRQVEEEIFSDLQIPYQRLNICTGDLGAPAAKKYDLEARFPGIGAYKEVTSTSNTTDFQTRRGNIKYKSADAKGYVHSLNGTAVAVGRTLAAIVENYQTAEGDIRIPEVLQAAMGVDTI